MAEQKATFGVALDPFRPTEILTPPGVSGRPPICPSDLCLSQAETMLYFLYINNTNNKGDVLLTCLNCGYETVYRLEQDRYEPRPGRPAEGWKPPVLDVKVAKRFAKGEVVAAPKAAKAPKSGKASKVGAVPALATPAAPAQQAVYSVKDAALQSGKSLDTLYEAVRLKRLKVSKVDGAVVVKQKDLVQYLKKYPARPKAGPRG